MDSCQVMGIWGICDGNSFTEGASHACFFEKTVIYYRC